MPSMDRTRDGGCRTGALGLAVCVLLTTLLLLPSSASANTAWDPRIQEASLHIDPKGAIGGEWWHCWLDGERLYAVVAAGVEVLDVSSPTQPKLLGALVTPSGVDAVFAKDEWLYVFGGSTLAVVDLTDPSQAKVVRLQQMWAGGGGYVEGHLEAIGNRLYLPTFDNGVKILDISQPGTPTILGTIDVPDYAMGVAVRGNKAYVGVSSFIGLHNYLAVANVTTPTAPTIETTVGTVGFECVETTGNYVYGGYWDTSNGHIRVYDVSGTVPAYVKDVTVGKRPSDMAIAGDRLYSVDATEVPGRGLYAFSLADPANPTLAGTFPDLWRPDQVILAGPYAYVRDHGGVSVVDVTAPASMHTAGDHHSVVQGAHVRVRGSTAFVTDYSLGLYAADLTTPTAPQMLSRFPAGQVAFGAGLDVTGTLAFAGLSWVNTSTGDATESLTIVDETVPTAPVLLGKLPCVEPTWTANDIVVSGSHAFVANGAGGLRVASATDTAHPAWVGSFPTTAPAHALSVEGTRAYVASWDDTHSTYGLDFLDVTTPTAPVRIGGYVAQGLYGPSPVRGLDATGNLLYIGVEHGGLQVLNVSDPAHPVKQGQSDENFSVGPVWIDGKTAYVTSYGGLEQYDILDPLKPLHRAFIFVWGADMSEVRTVGSDFVVAGPGLFTGAYNHTPTHFVRYAGPNRYATAASLSEATYPDGTSTVVVATGRDFPDALAGAPLAHALGAPLLLVDKTSVPPSATAEIHRLGAKRAVILGSEKAVAATVKTRLMSILGTTAPTAVERIGGTDRYETAQLIASKLVSLGPTTPDTAFIATGENYPDALAASGIAAAQGRPILLVHRTTIPAPTSDALRTLHITKTIVLGSEKVVGPGVYTAVHGQQRLAGDTRYGTTRAIADFAIAYGFSAFKVYVATATNFPDALASGVPCANSSAPLLLVGAPLSDATRQPVWSFVRDRRLGIGWVYVAGGPPAVPESVVDEMKVLLQ